MGSIKNINSHIKIHRFMLQQISCAQTGMHTSKPAANAIVSKWERRCVYARRTSCAFGTQVKNRPTRTCSIAIPCLGSVCVWLCLTGALSEIYDYEGIYFTHVVQGDAQLARTNSIPPSPSPECTCRFFSTFF